VATAAEVRYIRVVCIQYKKQQSLSRTNVLYLHTNPNTFRPIVPYRNVVNSVVEPDVSGPPESESGSNSMRYGSGSGSKSFYNQAKIVLKKFLLFCDFMTFYL
jgi:hypothetical protein